MFYKIGILLTFYNIFFHFTITSASSHAIKYPSTSYLNGYLVSIMWMASNPFNQSPRD